MSDTDTSSPGPNLTQQYQTYQQEVHQAADEEAAGAQQIVTEATAEGQQQIDLARAFASSQQPFTQPAPHDQINEVMSGAPWLFALTAIGGKASGLNGLAMLQGLNGMSDGLIKGDQQALDNSYKNYETAYDKWKTTADQQYRIYKELSTAYAGASDGKVRAMEAALKITGDARDKKLAVDDPERMLTMKAKLEEANAKIMEARAKIQAQNSFGPDAAALMGALAERGISLPTGMRSKEQQRALYQGLIARNPGKTPDEIADLIKSGQIEFGAEKKETQTAAAVAGRVEVAANEIKQFAPLVQQASSAVPRGSFLPINKLMQMSETQLQDPNLAQLKIYINSMLNAYDMLAARGGTDVKKREEAHALLTSAQSPEVLQKNIQAFLKEADAAGVAANAATKAPGSAPAASAPTRQPVAIGTSQSTGKTYIKYSDGTTEPLNGP
jgi:hypothetical protein